jgi:hypothetical protein
MPLRPRRASPEGLVGALLALVLVLQALASYDPIALQQAYSEVLDWTHFSPRWDIR